MKYYLDVVVNVNDGTWYGEYWIKYYRTKYRGALLNDTFKPSIILTATTATSTLVARVFTNYNAGG